MPESENHTELLLLPDGRILVHNLTPAMAALLHHLDPGDHNMLMRTVVKRSRARKSRAKPQTCRTSHKP
jgi:hypothetical protein